MLIPQPVPNILRFSSTTASIRYGDSADDAVREVRYNRCGRSRAMPLSNNNQTFPLQSLSPISGLLS